LRYDVRVHLWPPKPPGAVAALWLAIGSSVAVASAVGCSADKTAPPAGQTDASTHADTGKSPGGSMDAGSEAALPGQDAAAEAAPPTEAGKDGASDTSSPDGGGPTDANPVTQLGACLGMSQPLVVSGQMPYVSVPVGSLSGDFVLDFATTFSSIDLNAFSSTPTTMGCDPTMLFQICTVPGFAFFGPPGTVTLTTEDFSGIAGSVRQAGIIGTDFLSEGIFTLAYGAGLAFDQSSTAFCSSTAMTQAGFAPLSTAGFFENDLSLLKPFTSVDSRGAAGTTVPDVPTVPIQIAGVSAVAQLDTGFDDSVTKFSLNINEAFFLAIQAQSPTALVRDSSLDETLSTCVNGVGELVEGYRLAAGAALGFVAQAGTMARSYPNAVIFVKETPDAAQNCGGIGTWTVPAAQVGASYYVDMGVLAFDPYHETVWVPTL
jgi:hypothetical protein